MAKTTRQHYDKFKTYVYEWQRELGLDDWVIYVLHAKVQDAFADTRWDVEGMVATMRLSTSWEDRPITDKELRLCALHEILHVMTAPLVNEGAARYADEYTLRAAEHSIVRRISHYIMREL